MHEPEPGYVLVTLAPMYGGIPVPPKQYDSLTSGEILAVHPDDKKEHLIGRIGRWSQFQDDMKFDGNYAFIKLNNIGGTSKKEDK